jgi:DNA replication regulator SLD3
MPSQDGNQLSNASSTRRILTPPAEASQTSSDGALSGSRKRKRDGNTMEDLLKDPFAVKVRGPQAVIYILVEFSLTSEQPYPSTVYVKPRTLHPLLLLPRSNLPLSSLDATPFPNSLPQSRLFESHVKILELEDRMGSQPVVLIARLDDGRSLYAVEREARGLYVLFHLGSWVDLRQLRAAAVVSTPDLSKATEAPLGSAAVPQAAPLKTPQSNKYSKRKRLAIEAIQSMVKRPSTSLSAEPTPTETHSATAPPEPASDSPLLDASEPSTHSLEAPQPTANEIFENVRNQYFEALYLSKVCASRLVHFLLFAVNTSRHLWRTLRKDLYQGLVRHSTLIMTQPLTWPNILHSLKVL